MGLAGALAVCAQGGYNRVSVGYQATMLNLSTSLETNVPGLNIEDLDEFSSYPSDMPTLNGFTVDYRHGFQLGSRPMFIETGLGLAYASASKKYYGTKFSLSTFNLKIPVNFVYRFNLDDKFSVQPYTGINFKLNCAMSQKVGSEKEVNMFEDAEYGGKRFQMGWQIGVGVNFCKWYAGIEYGIDFIPAIESEISEKQGNYYASYITKINTQAFSINVGYTF